MSETAADTAPAAGSVPHPALALGPSSAAAEAPAAAESPAAPDLPPPARRRRGMYVLPSIFTAGNIAAGYYAILQSLQGTAQDPRHFDYAALAIGFAIPFDALDGRIARMTNTTSEFGKELDSLADVITFGVAPSLLAYAWGFHRLPLTLEPTLRHRLFQIGAVVCFMFLLCGAARLARFNSTAVAVPRNPGRADRKYFVGMPIPAAAGTLAAAVHFFNGVPISLGWAALVWTAFVAAVGFLMVSTWRFWSGKEINLSRRQPVRWMVLFGLFFYVLFYFSEYVLAAVALVYLFSGVLARLAYSWRRKSARAS